MVRNSIFRERRVCIGCLLYTSLGSPTDRPSGGHWSLLAFSGLDGDWYHFDSIDNCHNDYVIRLFQQIQQSANVDPSNDGQSRLTTFEGAIRQRGSWQCGLFLLMYAFILLHFQAQEMSPPSQLNDYLDFMIDKVSDVNRKNFTRKLMLRLKNLRK